MSRLEHFAKLVIAENDLQNLIARSTIGLIWSRHILDSVQLLALADATEQWLDIGTGGGFPGLAIAAVSMRPMTLAEPRRRRAEFLMFAAEQLGLPGVKVEQRKVEQVACNATTISARAVAPIEKLFASAAHCSTPSTRWLLLRGEEHEADVREAASQWNGVFHVKQSMSNPRAAIVLAQAVMPR
ncbi:16S rRNA (guanine(527)-N(7))-methyltransferase RsmG [Sphingomonas bacterium]|uniref:16S rRNA (guanine(527)-N(7))-methyltransferase RsmG n=1 Tax=Sphingomonas bacterium TaxID=1895847 RepID=UPI0020C605E7|nr:16S rRNA (guanine(527)-N(7))-methyltransferase RsmG [Sphingomonas bacterium]